MSVLGTSEDKCLLLCVLARVNSCVLFFLIVRNKTAARKSCFSYAITEPRYVRQIVTDHYLPRAIYKYY
jgi:hypothetical protein